MLLLLFLEGDPLGDDGSAKDILLVVGEVETEGKVDDLCGLEMTLDRELRLSDNERDCSSAVGLGGTAALEVEPEVSPIVTILTPFALSLTDGMNRVVLPSLPWTETRSG